MGGFAVLGGPAPSEGLGALCLACDAPLSLAPDCYPLVFRCPRDHFFTLNDLLDYDFPKETMRPGERPWHTLSTWEARARLLHEFSGRAFRDGHAFVAADFKEAARRVERWTSSLKMLLGELPPPASCE